MPWCGIRGFVLQFSLRKASISFWKNTHYFPSFDPTRKIQLGVETWQVVLLGHRVFTKLQIGYLKNWISKGFYRQHNDLFTLASRLNNSRAYISDNNCPKNPCIFFFGKKLFEYTYSPHCAHFGSQKKPCYAKFALVGLYWCFNWRGNPPLMST